MSKIAEDIKKVFDSWKNKHKESYGVCAANPFIYDFWMYYYLFPEILLIVDDYIDGAYKNFHEEYPIFINVTKEQFIKDCMLVYKHGAGHFFNIECIAIYPCFVFSEEEILRIMAECGII